MKKIFLMSCALFALGQVTVFGSPIDAAKALSNAKAFLADRGSSMVLEQNVVRRAPAKGAYTNTVSPFYVFNAENGNGFVLVNGDSRGTSVLGYSEEGSIDLDNLPPALQMQLDLYADQISMMPEGTQTESQAGPKRAVNLTREYVAPFLRVKWAQASPYNDLCPVYPGKTERCPAGCVNIAFAEALACFPGSIGTIEAIPAYTSYTNMGENAQELEDLEPYEVNWDNVKETYGRSDTEGRATAANIVQRCAWATHTSFAPTETGGMMADIPAALSKYFHFSDKAHNIHVTGAHDIEASIEEIYNEMAHKRPVVVGASAYANFTEDVVGHAYIIGGYDRDDYFYIDWGWGGACTGWFRFSAMSQYDDIVFRNFCFSVYCVVGIQPEESEESVDIDYYQPEDKSLQYMHLTLADDGKSVTVANCNMYPTEETFEQALGAYDENFNLKAVIQKSEVTYPAGVYTERPVHPKGDYPATYNEEIETTYTIPAKVTAGMRLLPVSRVKGTTSWHNNRCACDTAYIEMTANGLVAVPSYEVLSFAPNEQDLNQPAGAPVEMILKIRNNALDAQSLQMRLGVGETSVAAAAATYSEQLCILPHQSEIDLSFPFFEQTAGEWKADLWIYRAGFSGIGSSAQGKSTVTFQPQKTYWGTSDEIPLKLEVLEQTEMSGRDGSLNSKYASMYTDKYLVKFRITNSGNEAYNDYIRLLCLSSSGTWYKTKLEHLRLAAGESKEYEFYVDGLVYNTTAHMIVGVKRKSITNLDIKERFDDNDCLMNFYFRPLKGGIRYWNDEEHGLAVASATTFETPANATAVITAEAKDEVVITPNDNPNTLYYVKSAAEAANLEGKNVIMLDGTTYTANGDIVLTDGNATYVPQDFVLGDNSISYSRSFDKGNEGIKGAPHWSTIVLPFAADEITADGEEQDWFRDASESGKTIWMGYFYGMEYNKVYFKKPQELVAYKPYIITVASDAWGEEWDMTGKEITLSKSGDAEYVVAATPREIFNEARDMNFGGTLSGFTPSSETYKYVYLMNEDSDGDKFLYEEESSRIDAFRCFFNTRNQPNSINAGTSSVQIVFVDDNTTDGIRCADSTQGVSGSANGVYTISGVRVGNASSIDALPKGIYIINGKKIVK